MKQSWQPSASIDNLRLRAHILQKIRTFFASRNVLEVETPLLCHTSVTDPHIQSIPAFLSLDKKYYLQTSPEYAMKRLLVAGSGAIYQICKAFRKEEEGRFHNPEFTMLEWYRPGFTHHDLMQEMDEFLQFILGTKAAEKVSYGNLFIQHAEINPHTANLEELVNCLRTKNIFIDSSINIQDKDTTLQLLLTHLIEPKLGEERPCLVYDFPVSQAALARIRDDDANHPTAARFEVYFKGIELANGFYELQDVNEQRKRFEKNILERQQLALESLPIDDYFLAALQHGLPDCSGVALGVDRLIMLAANASSIADIISFDIKRA